MHSQAEAWKRQVSAYRREDGNLAKATVGVKRSEESSNLSNSSSITEVVYIGGSSQGGSPGKIARTESGRGDSQAVVNVNGSAQSVKSPPDGGASSERSREATVTKSTKTITSYFKSGENAGAMSTTSNSINRPLNGSESETGKENNLNSPSTTKSKEGTGRGESGTCGSGRESNTSASSLITATTVTTSIGDQRRLNDLEQRLGRCEAELVSSEAERKRLQEASAKQRSTMEAVYRKMALQEMRRRRDRLASDCVRIGKLVTQRTGPTTVAEVWEEGWALKDMNRKSAELLVRKEEIEKRRKKLANEKRRRKGSEKREEREGVNNDSNESGSTDASDLIELDIAAEEAAVRTHSDELKKDGEALQEERKLLEAEKAAHLKEIRRIHSEDHSRFARDLPCLNQVHFLNTRM